MRIREGKRLVEKGEETVNSVVNGKMKKHTKKNLTIFTVFLGVDSRQIDDSCLTYIMLWLIIFYACSLNTSPRSYHSGKSGHVITLGSAAYSGALLGVDNVH